MYLRWDWSSITRPESRSPMGRRSKHLSQDSGSLGSGFDSREVKGWSLRWVLHTRIVFVGYRGGFFPVFLDLSYSYSAVAKCPIQPIRKVVRVNDGTSEK